MMHFERLAKVGHKLFTRPLYPYEAFPQHPVCCRFHRSFHRWLVNTFLIINYSHVIPSMIVLLPKGEMAGVVGEIIVAVLERCEFDHKAMREPALPASVMLLGGWPSSTNLSALRTVIDSAR